MLIDDATLLSMLHAVDSELVTLASGAACYALVDLDYQESAPGDAAMDSRLLRVSCRTSDIPGVGVESLLTVRNQQVRVTSHQPDGQGLSVLFCEYAS